MARPIKNGLDYFPLDVNIFDDDKIMLIEADCGKTGVYIALRLLCLVYKDGYCYKFGDDELNIFTIRTGIDKETLVSMLNSFLKRGFFDSGVYEEYKVLTSVGIQRRYLEAKKKSIQFIDERYNLVSMQKRFSGVISEKTRVISTKTPVISEKTRVNSEIITQRKEKESKENKRKEDDKEKSPMDCSTEQQEPESTSTVIPTVEQPHDGNPPSSSPELKPTPSLRDLIPTQPKTEDTPIEERKVPLKERMCEPHTDTEDEFDVPSYVRRPYNREREEKYSETLMTDEKYLTDSAISTGIPLAKLKEYIPVFLAHCRATEASHRSSGDFKSHFINFVNKRNSQKSQNNGKDAKHNFSTDAKRRHGGDYISTQKQDFTENCL